MWFFFFWGGGGGGRKTPLHSVWSFCQLYFGFIFLSTYHSQLFVFVYSFCQFLLSVLSSNLLSLIFLSSPLVRLIFWSTTVWFFGQLHLSQFDRFVSSSVNHICQPTPAIILIFLSALLQSDHFVNATLVTLNLSSDCNFISVLSFCQLHCSHTGPYLSQCGLSLKSTYVSLIFLTTHLQTDPSVNPVSISCIRSICLIYLSTPPLSELSVSSSLVSQIFLSIWFSCQLHLSLIRLLTFSLSLVFLLLFKSVWYCCQLLSDVSVYSTSVRSFCQIHFCLFAFALR